MEVYCNGANQKPQSEIPLYEEAGLNHTLHGVNRFFTYVFSTKQNNKLSSRCGKGRWKGILKSKAKENNKQNC